MTPALDGLRVLDLSGFLAGPYCSMLLGDMGADVIKVERPEGDEMRRMPPFLGGEGYAFMIFNRNKRSVVLDLKTTEGRGACLRIARQADVLLENYRPGVAERLGFGYETMRSLNPRLVYCSVSGFGQTGPYRERGGVDRIAQAMSGLMSVNGEEEGPPLPVPVPISDINGGMFATIGILSALQARERTGRGQWVDTSLFETAVSLGVYEAAAYFATGEVPRRIGHAHRQAAPYQAFRTRDGWIMVGVAGENLWQRLCRVTGNESLIVDPRFRDNAERVKHRRELADLLQETFEGETTSHWLNQLDGAGIPTGPINNYDEVYADPHTRFRRMVETVDHPSAGESRILGVTVKLSETAGSIRRPAPLLGQHTEEVLAELESVDGLSA